MIRLKLGYLVIRATLLELAGFIILLPGMAGIFTQSMKFWEALLLISLGLVLMQDRYYVRWVVRRHQRRLEELAQMQESHRSTGEM